MSLWYGIRLRHYFYRKTFWYELKEILRTLIIFAVIEMAVMAFYEMVFFSLCLAINLAFWLFS